MKQTAAFALVFACSALGTTSCGGGGGGGGGGSNAPLVFALTTAHDLVSFRADAPENLLSSAPVTGLTAGVDLLTIDFRPANGVLYGIGVDGSNNVHLFTIATATAVATSVTATPFGLTAGGHVSMDFNAAVDRIRLVVGTGNLRVNPDTGGLVGTDNLLAYDAADPAAGLGPNVVGVAYGTNVPAAAASTCFAVDAGLDTWITLGGPGGVPSPNGGTLFTVGDLRINIDPAATDVDIRTAEGVDTAYLATITPAFLNSLFLTVEIATGATTLVGPIGGPDPIVSIAVQP